MTLPKNSPPKFRRFLTKNKLIVRALLVGGGVIIIGVVYVLYVIVVRRPGRMTSSQVAIVAPIVPKDTAVISDISLFLLEKGLKPTNIAVVGSDVTFEVSGTKVLLPLASLDNQLSVFWQIWSKFSALNKHLRKVDLRFTDPIITY